MRKNRASFVLFSGALIGAAFLLNACVTDSTDDGKIDTGGLGGSQAYAGNGGYAGDYYAGSGGYAGDYYAGSAGYAGDTSVGGTAGTAGTAGAAGGTDDSADVRFVDLIPDSGAIDICLQSSGSTEWQGPLGAVYKTPVNEFYYPGVSRYIPLPTGSWTVRVVAGDANDCNTPLNTTDQPVNFAKDQAYSVVFQGGLPSTFSVNNVPDRAAPQATADSRAVGSTHQ